MFDQNKDYSTKYPLLNQYLLDDIGPKMLYYLKEFNEFTKYMIEKYSFIISRKDAKKISIKDVQNKDPILKKKLQNFIKLWKNLKKYAIKYKYRENMVPKDFTENDKLIYFLNDNGEFWYGIYIAAAYQCFINWQNNFLQSIIDSKSQNTNLIYYINNLKNKVPVQKANNEILLINNFKNSVFRDFDEIIYSFSNRNIFNEDSDGKINYLNYNSFTFDFSSIEEELENIILPGKCLFDSVDKLNFMIFWGEGFRGGRSGTLIEFYKKYPQIDLNMKEKDLIVKYFISLIYEEEEGKYDFSKFYSSLNLIIFYLLNNNHNSEDKIFLELKKNPIFLKLSDDCKNFFSENGPGKDFRINKLMNIFFYIEHYCFEDLCETLQIEYRKEISPIIVEKIKKDLLNNKNEKYYTLKDLAAALRRFISRYLVGQRQEVEINERRELYYELTRQDLWEEKIGKLDNLDELIKNQLKDYKLTIGQSLSLYNIIGEKDKKENINKVFEPEPYSDWPVSDEEEFYGERKNCRY